MDHLERNKHIWQSQQSSKKFLDQSSEIKNYGYTTPISQKMRMRENAKNSSCDPFVQNNQTAVVTNDKPLFSVNKKDDVALNDN